MFLGGKKIITPLIKASANWYKLLEVDEINEVRLELAHKELEEQRAIIQERMEYRVNNARNKFEELKKMNCQKYQAKLEREIRRTNFKLEKLNRGPQKKMVLNKVYNPLPHNLYQSKTYHEVLCPEAIPSSLNDAYMMLERNLFSSKPFKKDYPKTHDCSIPKFYEIPEKDRNVEVAEELGAVTSETVDKEKIRRKKFKRSMALIATLVSGRAIQSSIYRDAMVNIAALNKKYNKGKYLYQSGIEEADKFQESVAAGIRDYNLTLMMKEEIGGLIRHLEGRTISNVLDFTSKEFLRLQEYRKLLTLADVAERERWTLEAEEGGRRQEEEQRLLQHEEMYKEVMKTHEISSDAILESILQEEIEKTGSGLAMMWTRVVADHYKEIFEGPIFEKGDPFKKLEYVSRLADRCLSTHSANITLKMQQERRLPLNRNLSEQIVKGISRSIQKSRSQDSLVSDETEPTDTFKTLKDQDIKTKDVRKDFQKTKTFSAQGLKSDSKMGKEIKILYGQAKPIDEYEVDMDDLANKLLKQIISKAENFVEEYEENLKKYQSSINALQTIHSESFSKAYQALAEELLKISGTSPEENMKLKINPWVSSVFTEAAKRASGILSTSSGYRSTQMGAQLSKLKKRTKKKSEAQNIDELDTIRNVSYKDLAGNLVDQITSKAENLVEEFHKNLQKYQRSANSLQSIYAESLCAAYQTMAQELLKVNSTNSEEVIKEKIHPWVNSVINEAVKRTSRLFSVSDVKANQSEMITRNKSIFMLDYFYHCPEENNGKSLDDNDKQSHAQEKKEVANPDDVFDYLDSSTRILYSGVLEENLHEKVVSDENILTNITKKP